MRRNIFTAEQIPKISGACLNEIKAEDNIIDFGKNKYFKYVSGDGQEHCLYTDNKGIGSIVSEIMRGEPYDPKCWKGMRAFGIT